MTKEHQKKVIEVLRGADKLIQNHYCHGGAYCALGYLAHKAGVSDEVLKAAGKVPITHEDRYFEGTPINQINRALMKHYGIGILEAQSIQAINDWSGQPSDRIKEVVVSELSKAWAFDLDSEGEESIE